MEKQKNSLIIVLIIIIVILAGIMAKRMLSPKQEENNINSSIESNENIQDTNDNNIEINETVQPTQNNENTQILNNNKNSSTQNITNNNNTSNKETPIQNQANTTNSVQNTVVETGEDIFNKANQAIENAIPEMENAATKAFNTQFKNYAGTQKGTSTKTLIQSVAASNATQIEHQVSIEYDGKVYSKVEELSNLRNSIASTKSYNISLRYDTNSYINKIIIVEQ